MRPVLPAVVLLQALPAAGATAFFLSGSSSLVGLALLCQLSIVCAAAYVASRCGIISFAALFVLAYTALHLLYPSTAVALDLYVPRDERVGEYAILTVGGLSLFLVAHAIASRRRLRLDLSELRANFVGQAFWIFLVPLVGAVALVAGSGASVSDLLTATRVDIKEEGSQLALLAQYLWVAGSASVVLGPLYLRRRPLGWIPFLCLVAGAGAAGFLAFRTRSVLVLLFGSLLMGVWLSRQAPVANTAASRRARRGLRSPRVGGLIVIGLLAVVAVSYVRVARGLFEQRGLAALADVDVAEALLHNMRRGDLAFTPIVFDVLAHVPERADYLKGQSYYRLFFVPIPRIVWPGKPPNTQRIVASWLNPDIQHQTTPPGIQGDLYINFGVAGVLGFAVFGVLFGVLDRWRGLGKFIGVGGGIVPVFHLVRGGFTNPVLLLATLIVAATLAAAIAEGRLRFTSGGISHSMRAASGTAA